MTNVRTVLRQRCAAFCGNLRIFNLRFATCTPRNFADWRLRNKPKDLRIFVFADCKKVFLSTSAPVKIMAGLVPVFSLFFIHYLPKNILDIN